MALYNQIESIYKLFASKPFARRLAAILNLQFAKDYLLTASSNLGITLIGAVGGILTARTLGPEGRGQLATAIVWAALLNTLATLGLPQALTYTAARSPEKRSAVYSMAMVLLVIQSAVAVLIGELIATEILVHFQPAAVNPVRLYLLSIPLSLMTTYLSTIAQGLQQFRLSNGIRIASAIGYITALCIVMIFNLTSVSDIISGMLIAQVAVAAGAMIATWRFLPFSASYEWPLARHLLSYGLKSYVGSLSWIANARFDQFVMSTILSLSAVGNYAVAVSYATLLFPLSGAFAMALFPRIAAIQGKDAYGMIFRTLRANLIISLCGAATMALSAPVLLPFVFGASFVPAVAPSIILVAGTVILGCNYILSDGLRGMGFPQQVSLAEIVGLVCTILGLLVVLPVFGIIGAAITSSISYFVVFVILLLYFRKMKSKSITNNEKDGS